MSAQTIDSEAYAKRWWITCTVMLAAVIEILDSTIVNVSLPNMMGSLHANIDQITWVLTSYIVSAAVIMPLTGFLVNRLGKRKLLLASISGFMVSSMFCGLSSHLGLMVFFRVLQGIFGASLVPLSQFILRDTFPKNEQGTAMAIWGMGIMCAPILGPTVGGIITEHLSWRWIFYINAPICLIAYLMTIEFIKETPIKYQSIDWPGLILMMVGIGSLQIFLDRGNDVGWYNASSSIWLTVLFITCLSGLVWHSLRTPHPVINLRLFQDRNFCISTVLIMLFVMMVFGQITLSPLMLQTLLNYPSLTAGIAMAPRGIASLFSMAIAGRLLKKIDARILIAIGIIFALYGTYRFADLNLDMSYHSYFVASIFQGIGMGFFFVPLATLALVNLKQNDVAEGAGLWSLSRNLGQSMGVSIMATVLSRMTQTNWNSLGSHIQMYNPNLQYWQQAAQKNWHDPHTLQILANQLQSQSQMIAFNDIAWLATLCLIGALPFVILLQQPKYLTDDSHSAGLH